MANHQRNYTGTCATLAAACMFGVSAHQSAQAAVTDEEFAALKQAVEQLGKKVQTLEATHEQDQATIRKLKNRVSEIPTTRMAAPIAEGPKGGGESKGVVSPASRLDTAVADLAGPLATHNFTMVGDAEVQFVKARGQRGTFVMADFAPIFLYRANDRVLFEAGFDFALQNNAPNGGGYTTTVNLSFATIDYTLNDYFTLVAGNMVLPLGTYSERSAGWMNKLPDAPLMRSLVPGSGVGAQLRGSMAVGDKGANFSYSAFVANGPGSIDGSGRAGQLDLGGNVGLSLAGNTTNNHGGMGYGGRMAYFYPWKANHDIEFGLSGMSGSWDNAGNRNYSAGVADVAMHFGPSVEIKGEYVKTWVATDDLGTIKPSGWYLQGGYKLSGIAPDTAILKNLEVIGRYDWTRDGMGTRTNRSTAGFVYYLTNTLWLEGAYEWMHSSGVTPSTGNQVIFQLSYGF